MYSRRDVIRALGALPFIPGLKAQPGALDLRYRLLGRTGRWVLPLSLGGQASLQWTGQGIDPAAIIVRAFQLGINYFDTANAYGPSQANYGEAFRRLHLTTADPEYNEAARRRIFIATKTGQRYAYDAARPNAAGAVSELRRSLTLMFGDGKGWIPEGAYLDSMQIHNLTSLAQVDQIYEGMDHHGARMPDRIGALAALLDYRDGTNYTGLNPEHSIYIRHIGITGHQSSSVLMRAIQRDAGGIIDTLLVGVNANDRNYCSHQYNVIPLAVSRGLGIIGMKVFADGVFYGKPARFSNNPNDVVLSVGRPGAIAPADLIRYPLCIPGMSTLITGIGRIDLDNPAEDQLVANLTAALSTDPASPAQMQRIEDDVMNRHGVETNYFNEKIHAIVQPQGVETKQDGEVLAVSWQGALAAGRPILSYNIYAGDRRLLSLPFRPQSTTAPLSAWVKAPEAGGSSIRVEASEEAPSLPAA